MKPLQRAARAVDRLSATLGRLVGWLLLLMVLVGAFNAVARYAGRYVGVNLSSNAWLELQWYLFGAVFLLGSADALRRDVHVRVDVLQARLSPRAKVWIDVLGTVALLLPFCVFGVVASLPSVVASWQVWEGSPDPGGLPRWPIKTLVPVAFAVLGLQGLAQLVHGVTRLRGEEAPR